MAKPKTKISQLKKNDLFRKVDAFGNVGKKTFILYGKTRAYNMWGEFSGWGWEYQAYDDISDFKIVKKDIAITEDWNTEDDD